MIEKLKEYKPCGRTTGHGESCVENYECNSCLRVKTLLEYIEQLEEKIPHNVLVETQDGFLNTQITWWLKQ